MISVHSITPNKSLEAYIKPSILLARARNQMRHRAKAILASRPLALTVAEESSDPILHLMEHIKRLLSTDLEACSNYGPSDETVKTLQQLGISVAEIECLFS